MIAIYSIIIIYSIACPLVVPFGRFWFELHYKIEPILFIPFSLTVTASLIVPVLPQKETWASLILFKLDSSVKRSCKPLSLEVYSRKKPAVFSKHITSHTRLRLSYSHWVTNASWPVNIEGLRSQNNIKLFSLGLLYLLLKHFVDRYNLFFNYRPPAYKYMDRSVHNTAIYFLICSTFLLLFCILFYCSIRLGKQHGNSLFTISYVGSLFRTMSNARYVDKPDVLLITTAIGKWSP